MADWFARGQEHIWLPYTQMAAEAPPVAARATDGVRITLDDGRTLIDGMASWWTAAHGYNHPRIVDAIKAQAEVMPHVMFGGLAHEGAYTLAARLADMAPGDLSRVFFSDSGSTAVEVALKLCLQYWINKGVEGRSKFVCFRGAYHGDTIGAMSVTDPEEGFHRAFAGAIPEQILADLPADEARAADYAELLERRAREIAGVIVEPLVQGGGGMLFHDADCLRAVVHEARLRDIPVIADEVFTGFGRTGAMFACAGAAVVPDVMCVGKALTGGALGMGATLARTHIFEAFLSDDLDDAFMHGPTFMANPLAAAAANASLDLFETEPRLAQVHSLEDLLARGLAPARAVAGVRDVRVRGAIGVVELDHMPLQRLYRLRRAFIERGLWVRPFGRIVYLTPAFVIGDDDLGRLTEGICKVLESECEV